MTQIKAVFFDWVGTLAHPEPDRHESVYQVAQGLGVELPADKLQRAVYKAENEVPAGAPGTWREGKDETPFIQWWQVLSSEVGVRIPKDIMLDITKRLSQMVRKARWVVYDDALPALSLLKQMGLSLGVISNLYIGGGSLDALLGLVVTAEDAKAGKPEPPIFLMALAKASVSPAEVIYVGDQYQTDVIGASRVGIKAILIDRYDIYPELIGCPIIHGLDEVIDYLQ